MAIHYAGQPLLLEDIGGQAKAWLDCYLPFEEASLFGGPTVFQSDQTGSRSGCRDAVSLPRPNYPDPPPLKINSLYWPTGAVRWSRGVFLATDSAKNAIVSQVSVRGITPTSSTLIISSAPGNGLTGGVGHKTISTEMYLLPPRPVSEVTLLSAQTEQLWLMPLVDERFYWQFKHVGVFEPATWAAAYASIATALGLTISDLPSVPASYGVPSPAEHWRSYANAAYMLDAVAHSVGQRVTRGIDGSVQIQTPTTAEVTLATNLLVDNWAQSAGGAIDNHLGSLLPEKVIVTFRNACGDGIAGTVESEATDHDLTGWVPDAVKVIHTNYPYNANTLADAGLLAARIAEDFYAWHTYRYDRSFIGIKGWTLSGYDDYAEWSIGRRRPDGSYEAQTRVQTVPYNFGVDESPAWDGCEEIGPGPYIGYLTEDMDAAEDTKTGATIAEAVRLAKNALGNLVERERVTLTNRSTSTTAEAGTMVMWHCINGEMLPFWVDCEADISSSSGCEGEA